MAPPGQPGRARRARRGVRRPEPRLPRHPAPDRGPRPARRAGRQTARRTTPRRCCWPRGSTTRSTTASGTPRSGRPPGPRTRSPPRRRRRSWPRWPGWSGSPRRTSPTTPTPTAARSPTPTWHPGRAARPLRRVRRGGAPRVRPPADDVFDAGRAAVLGALAGKPHLFHTAYAREHWEAPARANLERELASSAGCGRRPPGRQGEREPRRRRRGDGARRPPCRGSVTTSPGQGVDGGAHAGSDGSCARAHPRRSRPRRRRGCPGSVEWKATPYRVVDGDADRQRRRSRGRTGRSSPEPHRPAQPVEAGQQARRLGHATAARLGTKPEVGLRCPPAGGGSPRARCRRCGSCRSISGVLLVR